MRLFCVSFVLSLAFIGCKTVSHKSDINSELSYGGQVGIEWLEILQEEFVDCEIQLEEISEIAFDVAEGVRYLNKNLLIELRELTGTLQSAFRDFQEVLDGRVYSPGDGTISVVRKHVVALKNELETANNLAIELQDIAFDLISFDDRRLRRAGPKMVKQEFVPIVESLDAKLDLIRAELNSWQRGGGPTIFPRSPKTSSWSIMPIADDLSPALTTFAVGAVDRKMFVWGTHLKDRKYQNTGAIFDLDTRSWSKLPAQPSASAGLAAMNANDNSPLARHKIAVIGKKFFVWSTYAIQVNRTVKPYVEGAIFDMDTGQWSRLEPHSSLVSQTDSVVIAVQGKLIVAAGYDWGFRQRVRIGAIFDPVSGAWSGLPVNDQHNYNWGTGSVVEVDGKMVVFGGRDAGGGHLNSGSIFDPGTRKWTKIPIVSDTPRKRVFHHAFAYGKKMIVWGGVDSRSQPRA